MKFDSLDAFLAMGGHGPFVWSAYAIAAVVVVYNLVWPIVVQRKQKSALRKILE